VALPLVGSKVLMCIKHLHVSSSGEKSEKIKKNQAAGELSHHRINSAQLDEITLLL
jgi:hypothetical protein